MKKNIRFFVLVLAAVLLGCGVEVDSDGEVCKSDRDCKGDRICVDSVCTDALEPASFTGEDGGQWALADGGVEPEGVDVSEQQEDDAVTGTEEPPFPSLREPDLDAGIPADNGWEEADNGWEEEEETEPQDTAEPMDASAGDGSNVWAEPVPVDSILPFPVGECTAGFECVRQPIAGLIQGGDGFCVRPGGLAPPSCETDSDCADLNVECFDFAEHLPAPFGESMGLSMKWCALACDAQGIDAGVGDDDDDFGDADAGVDPDDDEGGQLCSNTCGFANDGECDDCGPGSEYSVCGLGTDCGDCGPRNSTDSCVSGGGSSSSTSSCSCSCSCSRCSTQTTRTCMGSSNADCLSCAVVCRDVCTTSTGCGSYLSSSGFCS